MDAIKVGDGNLDCWQLDKTDKNPPKPTKPHTMPPKIIMGSHPRFWSYETSKYPFPKDSNLKTTRGTPTTQQYNAFLWSAVALTHIQTHPCLNALLELSLARLPLAQEKQAGWAVYFFHQAIKNQKNEHQRQLFKLLNEAYLKWEEELPDPARGPAAAPAVSYFLMWFHLVLNPILDARPRPCAPRRARRKLLPDVVSFGS